MKKEDIEFLKQLQHEMLTQDNACQASPRFWAVMTKRRIYWVDDDVKGYKIVINGESVGDRGFFADSVSYLGDTITKANFDTSSILEVTEIYNNPNIERCFCYIDPETQIKVWTRYFYRVKQEGSKEPSCEGYTERGVCCGTCEYGQYINDEFNNTFAIKIFQIEKK